MVCIYEKLRIQTTFSLMFVFEQQKHHASSHVSDEYEDIDGAEDSKERYRGNSILLLFNYEFNSDVCNLTEVSRILHYRYG